jgi:hypothetical protein
VQARAREHPEKAQAAHSAEVGMNVFPIQTQPEEAPQAKCPNCGAAVVADQRYCLTCGQPCSPTRLAFLDVLQAESELRGSASVLSPQASYAPPLGYPPLAQENGAIGWLGRYSGLFGLLAVLLMTGLIGLLVGHWLAPSKAAGPQIVKIEGGVLPAATAAPVTSTTAAPSSPAAKTATTSQATSEAQEKKEVKEAESPKAKLKAPVKTSASSIDKLEKSTGKQHQKEIEKLTEGGKPIETGK